MWSNLYRKSLGIQSLIQVIQKLSVNVACRRVSHNALFRNSRAYPVNHGKRKFSLSTFGNSSSLKTALWEFCEHALFKYFCALFCCIIIIVRCVASCRFIFCDDNIPTMSIGHYFLAHIHIVSFQKIRVPSNCQKMATVFDLLLSGIKYNASITNLSL